jgi:hypothetical protein
MPRVSRVVAPKKRISKHDDPNNPLVFRNWKKDVDDVVASMPRGQECADADCTALSANRNAFLCKDCGTKYYDAYKNILSSSERARAQYKWLCENVLIKDPEA